MTNTETTAAIKPAKKTRALTPKLLLHYSTTSASNSAIGFINKYREYLETGELSPRVSPLLNRLDSKELLPTPCLDLIREAVVAHLIAKDVASFEASQNAPASHSAPKQWIAKVVDESGVIQTRIKENGEEVEMLQPFDKASDAMRWIDRRLALDSHFSFHGEIVHSPTQRIEMIEYRVALGRFYKQAKKPVMHQPGKGSQKLSFGGKVSQTRVSFSHG